MPLKSQNSRGGGFGRGSRGSFVGRGARGRGRGSFAGRGRGGTKRRGDFNGGRGSKRGRGNPSKTMIVKHRHEGIFIIRGKEDKLATFNLCPGETVYNEKLVSVKAESQPGFSYLLKNFKRASDASKEKENDNENSTFKEQEKIEFRVWNPFRSKLAAAVLAGVDLVPIKPGSKVLYLGAASGTTVSHCSDIVGDEGLVYAVEFSHRSGRDLTGVAKRRRNIVPIIADARQPLRYRMLMGMVDVIFSDVAQPDQGRIMELNAKHYLKKGGHFMISIKANCVDSTATPEAVFAQEVAKMREWRFKPTEQISLEPYERGHAMVVGSYRADEKES